jgi:polyferredoxin
MSALPLAIPGGERRKVMVTRPERRGRSWILLLLIVPFIALLYPPFYNFDQPEFIGIPFFYWFQLLWIIITAIITAVIYFLGA